jgi:hypothetical protein
VVEAYLAGDGGRAQLPMLHWFPGPDIATSAVCETISLDQESDRWIFGILGPDIRRKLKNIKGDHEFAMQSAPRWGEGRKNAKYSIVGDHLAISHAACVA